MPGRSKTDARYWLEKNRLFKDRSPDYSCRFTYKGRRERFCLKQPNRKLAAALAAEIYGHLIVHGWDDTLHRYKRLGSGEDRATTVGDVIKKARELSPARASTFDAYAKAFRKIVSEIEKIGDGRKFDAKQGGAEAWRKQVDAIPLVRLTPDRIVKWKNSRIKNKGSNPIERNKAIITANSLIRNAKALFAKRILPFLRSELDMPDQLPFEGVALEKSPSLRYHSTINAENILAAAHGQLAEADSEAYKVLVLALVCGLRKGEIDNLLWDRFDFEARILKIESTEYHELKSEDSSGVIDLNESTLKVFLNFRRATPDDLFVVESSFKPAIKRASRSYRCAAVFNRLYTWLRENGVNASKPLHTLRKEIGSVIASQHGIFQASRYLRHSDIRITAAFYADKKQRVVPDLTPLS